MLQSNHQGLDIVRPAAPRTPRARIAIVSPAASGANNGNWRTAQRWRGLLAPRHSARIVAQWPDGLAERDTHLLALHARRSAPSITAWAQTHPGRGLAVVLTGTDLYRDIDTDRDAQRSLELAQAIVVLQPLGPRRLPAPLRDKAQVILQSTRSRQAVTKTTRRLRVLMVGHLRDEKDPLTLMRAAAALSDHEGIQIDHIGAALDPALGQAAAETARSCPHYRWLDAQTHTATRSHIQRAHVLVHASRMEGGAHVIMEALCSGTPVIASDIDGNRGMLGDEPSETYFPAGDAMALALRLRECRRTQSEPDGLLARLARTQLARAPLFSPAAEQAALWALIESLPSHP